MRYAVKITERAMNDIGRLDKKIARRVVDKLSFFESAKNPLRFAERLTDFSVGSYRFRIGDYRAIFDIDKKGSIFLLMILRVKHRKEVYRA